MASTNENAKLPSMIDSRFTEEDLRNNFEINNTRKSATCKVENEVNGQLKRCNFKFNANESSTVKKFNLWRHVKRNHPEIYMSLTKKKDQEDKVKVATEKRSGRDCEGNNTYDGASTNKKHKMEQTKIDSFLKSSKVTVTMDADTFREGLMEMVCLSTTPLTTFRLQNKGFQKIAGEMAQKLGISTGHDAVRHLVISTADSVRADLKELLKEKLCYLKMDAATRGNRNFLAVNVQFYDEKKNKVVIKTLDIVDTKGKHDSSYVKNQVKSILEKFDITKMQILSICVDNAANMTCAVKNFSSCDEDSNSDNDIINGTSTESIMIEEEIEEHGYRRIENANAEQWVSKPSFILPEWVLNDESKVQLMRCGIHTLQLAIWDGLKKEHATKFLGKIRQVVVKLRTPNIRSILLQLHGLTQPLDTVTRWGSTFAMIDRLLVFQSYCEQVAAAGTRELKLTKAEWDEVKNLKELLAKPNCTTVKLQSADVTPGIFMKEWHKLAKLMQENAGLIALEIVSSMRKREENLFKNTHFLAGVYVDPRYRILLSSSQKLKAKEELLDIAQRLEKQNILRRFNKLQPSEEQQLIVVTVESDRQENNCTTASATSINSSEEDDFEKELDKQEKRRKISEIHNSNEEEFERLFNEDCEVMEGMGRLKVKSVFEAINKYPERMQAACRVASSMPTTQASVERLFSALKLILNDLRQSMKEDLLSAVLFYRINKK